MDDGRLPGEMTIEGLATRFEEVATRVEKVATRVEDVAKHVEDVGTRLDTFQAEVRDNFRRVDQQFNDAKIRDEALHSLMKFGLEARESLRESMERRFDALEKKQDEDISLLKDVLRHVTGTRAKA